MAIVSAKEVIGIGRQADIATVTTEFNAVPVDSGSFSASETYEQILDTGRRGTDALDFNAYQGVGSTEISSDFVNLAMTLHYHSIVLLLCFNFLHGSFCGK